MSAWDEAQKQEQSTAQSYALDPFRDADETALAPFVRSGQTLVQAAQSPSPANFLSQLGEVAKAVTNFQKVLGQGAPGVSQAVVEGPGKSTLKALVPAKLFQFLERSPERLYTSLPTNLASRGATGRYYPATPSAEQPYTGVLMLDSTYGTNPLTATHEGMHASSDFATIARLKRAGAESPYAVEPYGPLAPPRAFFTGGRTATDPLYARVLRDPEMLNYRALYREASPELPPGHLNAETVNEWAARNSLTKQGSPEAGMWGSKNDQMRQTLRNLMNARKDVEVAAEAPFVRDSPAPLKGGTTPPQLRAETDLGQGPGKGGGNNDQQLKGFMQGLVRERPDLLEVWRREILERAKNPDRARELFKQNDLKNPPRGAD